MDDATQGNDEGRRSTERSVAPFVSEGAARFGVLRVALRSTEKRQAEWARGREAVNGMAIDIAAARRAVGFAQIADSLRVALVVGTILNLINQGDALLAFERVDWGKLVLTYFVPFAVATYSAYRAYRALNLTQNRS